MLGGLISRRLTRRARGRAVFALVGALNALDYRSVSELLSPDAVMVDVLGRRIAGRDRILASDRAFREQADSPQITVGTLDHSQGDVLVRGHMDSPMPEIDGKVLWRVGFDGARIARIEIIRPGDLMSAPLFAAQAEARAAIC